MITEEQVKAKTDTELLEIWEHQNDYIAEMVTRVKAEIDRRNLDTSGIRVVTLEEIEKKKEAAEAKADRKWARTAAVLTGITGLITVGTASSLTGGGRLLASGCGLLLIVVSFGVWAGKRWGLISGLIFYALAAAGGVASIVFDAVMTRRLYGRSLPPEMGDVWLILISLFMAAVLNSLRKRVRMKAA